jgi:hypothetical protein
MPRKIVSAAACWLVVISSAARAKRAARLVEALAVAGSAVEVLAVNGRAIEVLTVDERVVGALRIVG